MAHCGPFFGSSIEPQGGSLLSAKVVDTVPINMTIWA